MSKTQQELRIGKYTKIWLRGRANSAEQGTPPIAENNAARAHKTIEKRRLKHGATTLSKEELARREAKGTKA